MQADKATIVGEAVTYIRTLEGTLQKLEKMKLERKRALAAQQHGQQQQLMVGAGSSSRASSWMGNGLAFAYLPSWLPLSARAAHSTGFDRGPRRVPCPWIVSVALV